MNLREMFNPPTPNTPVVYSCNPLVIVDDEGVIAFEGQAEIEFQPEVGPDQIGKAKVIGSVDGWTPELTVKSRIPRLDRVPDPRFGLRYGFTYFGEDPEGNGFAWHIAGAADLYLTVRASEEYRATSPVELLEIVDGNGRVRFSGPASIAKTPSVFPDRDFHLEAEETDLFLESLTESAISSSRNELRHGTEYKGTGPDGEAFTWYVGAHAPTSVG